MSKWVGNILIAGYIGVLCWGAVMFVETIVPGISWMLVIGILVWVYVVGGAAIKEQKEDHRCQRPPL